MSPGSGRRAPFILAIVIVAIGSWLYLRSKPATPAPIPTNAPDGNLPVIAPGPVPFKAASAASNSLSVQSETPPQPREIASAVTNPPLTVEPALVYSATAAPDISPEVILGNMRNTIRLYSSMFGENPVGNNAEITRALNGENPKQTKFLKVDAGLRVNGSGELVDPWGTPFFFHQLSAKEMEIRSAGPDRRMWTLDDLVVK